MTIKPRLTDILEPEGWQRSAIDRPIKPINNLFTKAFGWRQAPIQTAADMAIKQSHISIGDIGCGSGNTLRTWAREIGFLTAGHKVDSSLIGVNKYDYSRASTSPATLAAIENHTLKYIVADATNMPLKDHTLDVSLAYTTIEYCSDPGSWMKEMLRVTRPNGVIFFTADTRTQFRPTHPLPQLLHEVDFEQAPSIMPMNVETVSGNTTYMTLVRLVVPAV